MVKTLVLYLIKLNCLGSLTATLRYSTNLYPKKSYIPNLLLSGTLFEVHCHGEELSFIVVLVIG